MPYNDRLFTLLRELDDAELESIWVKALRRELDDEEFSAVPRELRIDLISREWRAVHGHTLVNIARRSHELPWKRILIDVADKMKPGWGWSSFKMDDESSEEEIEHAILEYFDERVKAAWAAMKEEERTAMADRLNAELSVAQRTRGVAGLSASAPNAQYSLMRAGLSTQEATRRAPACPRGTIRPAGSGPEGASVSVTFN